MPYINDFNRTDFINLAHILGIKIKINGTGSNFSSSLKEGDIINKDTILTIDFKEVIISETEEKED